MYDSNFTCVTIPSPAESPNGLISGQGLSENRITDIGHAGENGRAQSHLVDRPVTDWSWGRHFTCTVRITVSFNSWTWFCCLQLYIGWWNDKKILCLEKKRHCEIRCHKNDLFYYNLILQRPQFRLKKKRKKGWRYNNKKEALKERKRVKLQPYFLCVE